MEDSDEWRLRRTVHSFATVDSLRVLSIVLNAEGSTETMIAHRDREAQKVWHRHRALTSGNVPPRQSVARLHQTVGASALHGAGMLAPGASARRRLTASEMRLLRQLAGVQRNAEESGIALYQTNRLYRTAELPTFWA